MGVNPRLPNPAAEPLVERHAQSIADPVERLRYLRQTMGASLFPEPDAPAPRMRRLRPRLWHGALLGIPLAIWLIPTSSKTQAKETQPPRFAAPVVSISHPASEAPVPNVWLVEHNDAYDAYSNGLRIENAFVTANEPRRYLRYSRRNPDESTAEWRTEPAGIVYHTTESLLVPFEPSQNNRMKRLSANVLSFIKQNKSYHFVIDRFGRVFRVVQESDSANHAGNSVWADRQWAYVGLNRSFFGVAFEAQTNRDGNAAPVSAAQFHAARILTEMLRHQYGIASVNCVTHAQVSVNPSNRKIGYHTDWAGQFPFRDLGLPDNYDLPLPSLSTFGFDDDSAFAKATGGRMWRGLQSSREEMQQQAGRQGLTIEQYRAALQDRYRKLAKAQNEAASEEKSNGTD